MATLYTFEVNNHCNTHIVKLVISNETYPTLEDARLRCLCGSTTYKALSDNPAFREGRLIELVEVKEGRLCWRLLSSKTPQVVDESGFLWWVDFATRKQAESLKAWAEDNLPVRERMNLCVVPMVL